LGITAYRQSDYRTAQEFGKKGLSISRQLNDQSGIAVSLNLLGDIYRAEHNYQEAQKVLEESLELCRTESHLHGLTVNCCSLGMIAFEQNDEQKARTYFAEALEIGDKLSNKFYISNAIDGFAGIFANTESELKRATKLAGAAEQFRQLSGINREPAEQHFREKYLSKIKSKLSETDFSEFYEQGRKLSLEESFALCLENVKK
jgi:tetratricopeptide (TPR) repeat protein